MDGNGSIPLDKDDVQEKAKETIRLSRGELWLLKIAAATGVMSFISHGIQFVTMIGHWLGWF